MTQKYGIPPNKNCTNLPSARKGGLYLRKNGKLKMVATEQTNEQGCNFDFGVQLFGAVHGGLPKGGGRDI